MSKKKKPPEETATPVLPPHANGVGGLVTAYRALITAIKQNPDLVNHPDLLASVTALGTKTDLVDTTEKAIVQAKLGLQGTEATQVLNVADMKRGADGALAVLSLACKGSAAAITGYGADVRGTARKPPTNAAPVHVVSKKGKVPGGLRLAWQADKTAKGYMVQQSSDPANPQGWSASVFCPLARYEPVGLVTGQTVYYRVAAERTNGLGLWSVAVSAVVT